MMEYVRMQPLLFAVLAISLFIVHRLILSRLITTKVIDVFILSNISIAISMAALMTLGIVSDYLRDSVLHVLKGYAGMVAGMLISVWLLFHVLKKPSLNSCFTDGEKDGLISQISSDKTRRIFFFLLALVLLYKLFFSYTLITQYSSGDARLVLQKSIRGLDILFSSLEISVRFLIIAYAVIRKRPLDLIILAAYLALSFLSGSKGAILSLVLLFFVIQEMVGKRKISSVMIISVFGAGVLSFLLIRSFWSGHLDMYGALARIVGEADIYHMALVANSYEVFNGFYDTWSYIFHPFTALFGVRGYDYPLGSWIFSLNGFPASPYGPNPQLPMLNAVLFPDGQIPLFPFILGILMIILMYLGFRSMYSRRLDIFTKTSLLYIFYLTPISLFADLGYWEIQIVKGGVSIAILLILGEIYDHIFQPVKKQDKAAVQ